MEKKEKDLDGHVLGGKRCSGGVRFCSPHTSLGDAAIRLCREKVFVWAVLEKMEGRGRSIGSSDAPLIDHPS